MFNINDYYVLGAELYSHFDTQGIDLRFTIILGQYFAQLSERIALEDSSYDVGNQKIQANHKLMIDQEKSMSDALSDNLDYLIEASQQSKQLMDNLDFTILMAAHIAFMDRNNSERDLTNSSIEHIVQLINQLENEELDPLPASMLCVALWFGNYNDYQPTLIQHITERINLGQYDPQQILPYYESQAPIANNQKDITSAEQINISQEDGSIKQSSESVDHSFSIADLRTLIEKLINSEYRWPTVLLIVSCAVSLISGAFVNLIATLVFLFVLLKQETLPPYALGVPATLWAIGLLIHGQGNLTVIKILSCCLVLVLWFYLLKAKENKELGDTIRKVVIGMFVIDAILGIPAIFSRNSLPSAHVVFCLCYGMIFWDEMRTKIHKLTSGK